MGPQAFWSSKDDMISDSDLDEEEYIEQLKNATKGKNGPSKALERYDQEEGANFDREKLRKYELNKMKYYFAVVDCDSIKTANTIYEECDGQEFQVNYTIPL